jgi:hypothetical protein
VSRPVSASLNDGPTGLGTQKQQSYTFDAFGNLQTIAGTSGRSTPTSSQTNRLSGAVSYEAANAVVNYSTIMIQEESAPWFWQPFVKPGTGRRTLESAAISSGQYRSSQVEVGQGIIDTWLPASISKQSGL